MDARELQREVARLGEQVTALRRAIGNPAVRQATGGGSGGGGTMMRVKSEQANTVTCREWDGTTEGSDDILVAKPVECRRATYDGTTNADGWLLTYASVNTRTATKTGETTQTHEIFPPYAVNSVIFAEQPVNGTGLDDVTWRDTNDAAREFTEEC